MAKPVGNTPVTLHVYDLSESNVSYYKLGFGLYHSGIEVNGVEYSWGTDGPFRNEPKKAYGVLYRESILLGHTNKNSAEITKIAADVAETLKREGNYHILQRNCNHFAKAFSEKLVPESSFPGWVNRAAGLGSAFSWMLPKDAFGDRAVPNGSESVSFPADLQQSQQPSFSAFSGEGRALGSSASTASSETTSNTFFGRLSSWTKPSTSGGASPQPDGNNLAKTSSSNSLKSNGGDSPVMTADRRKILEATQQRLKSSSASDSK